MPFATQPFSKRLNLPLYSGEEPQDVSAVLVPLPKNTTATIFGQRIALWSQRFNTYLLNSDELVINPQAIWEAPTQNGRFSITTSDPPNVASDNRVLLVGPFTDDRFVAVVCSHKKQGQSAFEPSALQHSFQSFKIQSKDALSFTLINAEDGGDHDYHDTVVGVAVTYTTK